MFNEWLQDLKFCSGYNNLELNIRFDKSNISAWTKNCHNDAVRRNAYAPAHKQNQQTVVVMRCGF